jgi:transcriptional regulator of acetoin/glycerol metabolism
VRELLNVVRYLSATVPQELQIELHHLPVALQPIAREHQTPGNPRDAEVIAPEDVKAPPPSMPTPPATLRMVERAVVEHALAACEGRVDLAAQRLGISRATLYRRLAQWRN